MVYELGDTTFRNSLEFTLLKDDVRSATTLSGDF